jgi:hypothetical protein
MVWGVREMSEMFGRWKTLEIGRSGGVNLNVNVSFK